MNCRLTERQGRNLVVVCVVVSLVLFVVYLFINDNHPIDNFLLALLTGIFPAGGLFPIQVLDKRYHKLVGITYIVMGIGIYTGVKVTGVVYAFEALPYSFAAVSFFITGYYILICEE